MRANRKDVGHTYNSATGCTLGKGTSGCSEAGCHTNVCSSIRCSGDVLEWHALYPLNTNTLCYLEEAQSVHMGQLMDSN